MINRRAFLGTIAGAAAVAIAPPAAPIVEGGFRNTVSAIIPVSTFFEAGMTMGEVFESFAEAAGFTWALDPLAEQITITWDPL